MFAVAEVLHSSLQGLLRLPVEIALHVSGQTFGQHFGAMLQVSS